MPEVVLQAMDAGAGPAQLAPEMPSFPTRHPAVGLRHDLYAPDPPFFRSEPSRFAARELPGSHTLANSRPLVSLPQITAGCLRLGDRDAGGNSEQKKN